MPRAVKTSVDSLAAMASSSVVRAGVVARGRALNGMAVVATAMVLAAACTTTTGPTPTMSTGGLAAEQASLVVVADGMTVVKGKALPAVCNGVTAPEQVITTQKAVLVPLGTTAVMPTRARFTMCAPEAYQPTKPVDAGRTPVKVRMYYTNPGPLSRYFLTFIDQVIYADGRMVEMPIIDGELGIKTLSYARILPGESATWEVAYAVPAEKVFFAPFLFEPYLAQFEITKPAAGAPPQVQPQLPSATPAVTPKTLPVLEPGMTMSPGHTGVIEGDIPHTCGGKATGVVHPVEERKDSLAVIPPGDSALVTGAYRVTLCPGAPYQPSPEVFPKGDYEYRLFTAYETMSKMNTARDPVEFFVNVSDAQGNLIPQPVGRVLDPTVVAYADRAPYDAGKTMVWTFAVAYPKTGGPYFLRTSGAAPAMWPLT